MNENMEKKMLKGISAAVTVLLILMVVLCLYVVVQVLNNGYVSIGGIIMFRVVTGSMEPTIPVGALLVTREMPINQISLNDIVCFKTQEAQIYGSVVTHRVVDVFTGADGALLLETKGDANPVADVYFVSQENFLGKVVWYSGDGNVLATVFSFLTDKVGFLGCIVFPCLILATLVLRSCVNNIRQELEQAKEEMRQQEQVTADNLLSSMTPEQYEEMVAQIRTELAQELMRGAQIQEGEHHVEAMEGSGPEDETTE